MSDIALRPRSATEIVDAAFQVYRREPLQFIVGMGLIYVPWHVIAAILNVDPSNPGATGDLRALLLIPLALIVYPLASAVTIVLAADVYFGRKAEVTSAFSRAWKKLGSLIVAMFALGLIFMAVALVAGLLVALFPEFIVRVAFIIAAVAAGIYAGVRLFALRQTIILEDATVGPAIERSWRLSQNQWGHIAGTLTLATIILIVVIIGGALIGQMIPSKIAQSALSALASILVVPVFGISETVLYYDTRIRNEGFDVEYLAASVPVTEQAGA